jgi:hypothetical protein
MYALPPASWKARLAAYQMNSEPATFNIADSIR